MDGISFFEDIAEVVDSFWEGLKMALILFESLSKRPLDMLRERDVFNNSG